MKTNFISTFQVLALKAQLEKGDPKAIEKMFQELQRLQSIIVNYELTLEHVKEQFERPTNKDPKI
jgi:hypothetical protein